LYGDETPDTNEYKSVHNAINMKKQLYESNDAANICLNKVFILMKSCKILLGQAFSVIVGYQMERLAIESVDFQSSTHVCNFLLSPSSLTSSVTVVQRSQVALYKYQHGHFFIATTLYKRRCLPCIPTFPHVEETFFLRSPLHS